MQRWLLPTTFWRIDTTFVLLHLRKQWNRGFHAKILRLLLGPHNILAVALVLQRLHAPIAPSVFSSCKEPPPALSASCKFSTGLALTPSSIAPPIPCKAVSLRSWGSSNCSTGPEVEPSPTPTSLPGLEKCGLFERGSCLSVCDAGHTFCCPKSVWSDCYFDHLDVLLLRQHHPQILNSHQCYPSRGDAWSQETSTSLQVQALAQVHHF